MFTQFIPDEWIEFLNSPKLTVIDSSQATIERLRRNQARNNHAQQKMPDSVEQFLQPLTRNITTMELLHSIGVVTTPIIPKFADICSTWAIYRYIWAFSRTHQRLALSSYAKDIDFHQKGLLSDEIGVGMVYWVMKNFFDASTFIDVDILLRNPALANNFGFPNAIQTSTSKPDYIFISNQGAFSIVESKGTQSGKAECFNQIKRGLEQVPSIHFEDDTDAEEFVIATSITTHETTVYVIDPPKTDEPSQSNKKRKNTFDVKDKGQFNKSVSRSFAAKLAAFAGFGNISSRIAGINPNERDEVKIRPGQQRKEIREYDTAFIGQIMNVPLRGQSDIRIELFFGIEEGVLRQIASRDFIEGDQIYFNRPRYADDFDLFQKSTRINNNQAVSSVDRDGTILSLSLSINR